MKHLPTRFLLVDDDEDDALLFREAVGQLGPVMKCFIAESGEKVFEVLSQHHSAQPHIIFLDINMPIMNGWDCLERLKEDPEYRHIPVIIYSTSSAKQDVDKAYNLGALTFVTKPEDFKELTKILHVVAKTPHDKLLGQLRHFGSVKMKKVG